MPIENVFIDQFQRLMDGYIRLDFEQRDALASMAQAQAMFNEAIRGYRQCKRSVSDDQSSASVSQ